jgi:monoamine oxidase
MEDVDVVIVGAGSAGLAAAKTLRAAGRSFKVLEAMNRIGGRAWTSSEHFGIPFDIGCAWIHAADRNPYFEEAKVAGWMLEYHDMNVDHLYFGRKKASEQDEAEMKLADVHLAALLETHDGRDDRVSALLSRGRARRAAATFAGPMDFGNVRRGRGAASRFLSRFEIVGGIHFRGVRQFRPAVAAFKEHIRIRSVSPSRDNTE